MLQQTLAKAAHSVQCSLRQLESSEQRKGRRVRMSFTHERASSCDAGQFMYAPRDCKIRTARAVYSSDLQQFSFKFFSEIVKWLFTTVAHAALAKIAQRLTIPPEKA